MKIIITENQLKLINEAVGVPKGIMQAGEELYEIVLDVLKTINENEIEYEFDIEDKELQISDITIDNIKVADLGFYINLDRRTDRKEHLLKNLEEYNIIGVERQSAREDTNTTQLNLVNTNFDLYRKFLDTDAETLLVLEDDCKFLPSIKQNTKEIFENISM